jgi:hypothetical protein
MLNTKNKALHFQIATITPKMATEWLALNSEHQRTVNTDYVDDTLVPAILENDFMVTGNNNIIFDWDGRLIDGQHRLKAIVKAGKPVEMVIVTGVNPKARDKIDIGRRRSVGNVLQMLGHTDSNRLAAALRWAYAFMNPEGVSLSDLPAIDARKLSKLADEWEDLKGSLKLTAGKRYRELSRAGCMLAGFHYAASQHNKELADKFIATLPDDGDGYDHGAEDPRYQLMVRMRDAKAIRAARRCEQAAWVIKSFNAFARGAKCRQIKISKDESFPRISVPRR